MTKNTSHFKNIVLGATAFGSAFAVIHSEETAVIDDGILVCPEFCSALRCHRVPMDKKLNNIAERMKTDYLKRGIIDEQGNICITSAPGFISAELFNSGVTVLLGCTVTALKKKNGVFTVEYYGHDGFNKLTAERIIDTRADGNLISKTIKKQRYLRVALASENKNCKVLPETVDGAVIEHGQFKDEYMLAVAVSDSNDWIAAREKVFSWWQKHCDMFSDYRIAAFAGCFDVRFEKPFCICENGIYFVPSAAYVDIITAVEEGSKWNIAD